MDVLTELPRDENQTITRFPCFETVLGVAKPIHECLVECVHRGVTYNVIIAAQYDPDTQVNRGLKTVYSEANWRGSVLVMKAGYEVLVTGLHGSVDNGMVSKAVRKLVACSSLWFLS